MLAIANSFKEIKIGQGIEVPKKLVGKITIENYLNKTFDERCFSFRPIGSDKYDKNHTGTLIIKTKDINISPIYK